MVPNSQDTWTMASTIEEPNFYILYNLIWLVDTVLNSTILEGTLVI